MNKFAENLKKFRSENKLSQKQLSSKLKISQQAISEYENNKIEPCMSILIAIADEFNVTIDELVGRVI